LPRKRIASAPCLGPSCSKSIRKGDDASDATLIPVYTSKRKPPRALTTLPPGPSKGQPNVLLPLAYRAPMSAIGRSVGIESNLVSVRSSFHLRLLGAVRVYGPAVSSPKRQNPSGKQAPLLPPAQSPRLHFTLTLNAMGLFFCLPSSCVCCWLLLPTTTSHVAKLLQR
jgi:hypothetical protein